MYDFDNDQISLGVNVHSQGKVAMYKPGERPAEFTKAQVSEDNIKTSNADPADNEAVAFKLKQTKI